MKRVLPVIVVSQFLCTSLWFAGNAIMPDIIKDFHLQSSFLGNLTSAVQFGFISGTLIFALFTISDRYSPSLVFLFCSIIGAVFNLGIVINNIHPSGLLAFRFLTGFFLAGIYPVGMKIAADYYQKGLGKSLGFLVGALVLGTAFPHLIRSLAADFSWRYVIFFISGLSVLGGLAMYLLVPDGPFRKQGRKLDFTAFLSGFRNKNFRSAAFGYFGHMWELYTFWAFVPVMLTLNKNFNQNTSFNVSLYAFLIIASGGLACVVSGLLSQKFGAKRIASLALFLSGFCCIVSPFFLLRDASIFITFLFFWALMVIADSPLFSTLVAQNVAEESRGTSLTIVNCIGFSITIISIELINALSRSMPGQYLYLILAAGPVFGLISLIKNKDL